MTRMLHHVSLPVTDLDASAKIYDAALEALHYGRVCTGPGFVGYGLSPNKDQFALKESDADFVAGHKFHLAFGAPSVQAVELFHERALEHGAMCNGPPGLRTHYGPNYYAAFIIDLDGHRIEAVINE